jgi:hypothetical protein
MCSTVAVGALGAVVWEDEIEKEFVRQYFDNGLAVYDAAGKRLGIVADYDRPGGGFVVNLVPLPAGLYLPMRLVRRVRRGKVYLSELARNLTTRPLEEAHQLSQPRPLLRRVMGLLSGRVKGEEASA